MELTSSHLCFTTRSPTIAVITCFWPDHLELHGSLERYRAAKEAIVRRQGTDDIVVVNEDDADAAAIARLSPGHHFGFSTEGEVDVGALHRRTMVLRDAAGTPFKLPPRLFDPPRLQALLAAAATTAAGALPGSSLRRRRLLRRANLRLGLLGDTELIDDGSHNPAKTVPRCTSTLTSRSSPPAGSFESAACPCRAEEQALLEDACAEARRVARLVVLLARQRSASRRSSTGGGRWRRDLDEAIVVARPAPRGCAGVVSPMFPPLPGPRVDAPALEALAATGNTL
jgi:hypothetical protein